ncbi:MAG: nucleotidyltransferase domain-containing protein [Candidatus Hydrogenedentota bacterium]
MEREALLQRIKEVVRGFDPEAEIILYGSRARGDAEPGSDWDLLVLLSEEPDRHERNALMSAIHKVELASDEILVPIIRTKEFWDSKLARAMPLHENIDEEGIRL